MNPEEEDKVGKYIQLCINNTGYEQSTLFDYIQKFGLDETEKILTKIEELKKYDFYPYRVKYDLDTIHNLLDLYLKVDYKELLNELETKKEYSDKNLSCIDINSLYDLYKLLEPHYTLLCNNITYVIVKQPEYIRGFIKNIESIIGRDL